MVDVNGDQDPMNLPPGFRFHPLDVELITDYLSPKAMDHSFCAVAIGEVDLNKCEPWDLPRLAKMGEKEWYFFVVKDRKYPTGMRTNRATEAGYWKATGKDKEIFKERSLVGMKKTLVFYQGRAPKGEKSNWVMHEYRLEGETSLRNLPLNTKNEWVICRIFHKSSGGKKVPYTELMISNSFHNEYSPSGNLPPLTESSPGVGVYTKHAPTHVSCFSNTLFDGQTSHNNTGELSFDGFNNHPFHSVPPVSNPSDYFSTIEGGNPYFMGNYMMSEQNVLRAMLENQGTETKQSMKTEEVNYNASQDNCLSSDINAQISSVVSDFYMGSRSFDDPDGGAMDVDQFLNYR